MDNHLLQNCFDKPKPTVIVIDTAVPAEMEWNRMLAAKGSALCRSWCCGCE